MVGTGCFATKTKKYNRIFFFKNKTGKKKRFLCCLLTMIKNGWVKKRKKAATDVNYIPRTEKFRKTI